MSRQKIENRELINMLSSLANEFHK